MSRVRDTFTGKSGRELLIAGAHLGALWAFAFVQPLLDLLGKNPDFFVARANTSGDIVIFAVAFTLLPPLALLALEAVVALISRRARLGLHLVLVALLAAVFFVQIEKRIFSSPAGLMIVLALIGGAAFAYGLQRTRFVRSLLDVLSVAPVVFLVIFLFFSDTSKLILPQQQTGALGIKVPSKTPVVVVIFDEFPTATLLNPDSRTIDARRFPNFAALAKEATWYRNNTTVADFTGRAVPAIMTGINPAGTSLPIASEQPNSIFSLLGGTYRLNVHEAVTKICPESLCGEVERPRQLRRLKSLVSDLKYVEGRIILPPALANELPNVSTTFGDFGNNGEDDSDKGAGHFAQDLFTPPTPNEFQDFLKTIPDRDRTLSLIHMEVPHDPWRYLPNGQSYLDTSISGLSTPNAARWAVGSLGIASAQARHVLQAGYADTLVGLLIRHLKKIGLWKRAMVVVTADHGISFQGGQVYRRIAEQQNLGAVGNPPLFIHYPGQSHGGPSPIHSRTVDIVPTIAQQLQIKNLYPTDGRPISEDGIGGPVSILNGKQQTVTAPLSKLLRERRRVVGQEFARLGRGPYFRFGPFSKVIGRRAPALSSGIPSGKGARIENVSYYEKVDPSAQQVPAFVAGHLKGVAPGTPIAVSLNGTIAGTCHSFNDQGDLVFGVVVPPETMAPGRNAVGVYEIGPGGSLTPLGGN